MKNVIKMFVLMLFVVSCSTEDANLNVPDVRNDLNNSDSSVAMSKLFGGGGISFSIGRNSRDCAGLSICKVKSVTVIIEDHTITWTNQNRASVACNYIKVDNDKFYFLLDKSIIEEFRQIQGGDHFVFEESFILDEAATTKMAISEGFRIGRGTYPIIYDAEHDIYKVLMTNSI